jgi:hypothetical protein
MRNTFLSLLMLIYSTAHLNKQYFMALAACHCIKDVRTPDLPRLQVAGRCKCDDAQACFSKFLIMVMALQLKITMIREYLGL